MKAEQTTGGRGSSTNDAGCWLSVDRGVRLRLVIDNIVHNEYSRWWLDRRNLIAMKL
jgi:hypothetical protein